ncbi:MAG TPA: TolC family protein, partial [Polyangiaceae bacterium]|nr:TolC family protein [Polyangiaceae bacterium]
HAESAVANAQLLETRAKSLFRVSAARLRTVMHEPRSGSWEIGEQVLRPQPGDDERTSPEALVREALSKRLELQALERTAHSLQKQSDVLSSQAIPRLEAFGNAYYSNPNQRIFPQEKKWRATWDVGLQITWSPNDLGTAPASARGLDAQRGKVSYQKKALEDAVLLEVTEAVAALKEARASVKTAETAMKSAEASYRVRRKLYQYGRGTALEVFDAEVALLRSRLTYIDAFVSLRIARVQLDHAVGRDVRDV